jgi:NADH-quinone oxidoreductase subunit D
MLHCIQKLREPEGQGPVTTLDGKVAPPSRKDMKRPWKR